LEKRRSLLLISVALAPSVLLFIADLVIGDYNLFTLINQEIANPILDFACAYASPVLFSVFYVLTLVALHFSRDNTLKASGIVSLITGPLSYGIGSLVKVLVGRPRPFEGLLHARVIGLWHTSSFSLPSTTTMLALGFALPILLEKPRLGTILVAFSYFIGFSVVYTGFHFPLDVAAGSFLSLVITLFTNGMKNPIANLLKKYKTDKHRPNLCSPPPSASVIHNCFWNHLTFIVV